MKIQPSLLKAIAITISVGAISYACQKTDANSGKEKPKQSNEKEHKEPCPACGMG
ncbi:MAG: hypothetical protein V4638_07880 [Bacteroidota bacterium]